MLIDTIHESLVQGKRQQMVNQIEEYGVHDFWSEYHYFLEELHDCYGVDRYFSDAVISYFRIKER